ncbi:ABC transporter substrate-binding protein [uncultured Shewanella sp.]|uniref:ABC transporter substrate-binding protein n=1 Tax=uncultured Shewanella sp. TaxID=173975 RepID=UPI002623B562|nr:ABC transporter substrate-binding protein [uncultured Shewanella sp.]
MEKHVHWLMFVWTFSSLSFAECQLPTNDKPPIVLGMSTALSGPVQYLGESMRDGVQAYFNKVNCLGGLHGREVKLITRDDGYQPSAALMNVKKLIMQDEVLAIIGNVGTPTAKLTAPYITQQKRVFYAPYTGAGILRNQPADEYIFNFRASYAQEMQAIIKHIFKNGIKPGEIAFFLQDDAYGQAGLNAATKVLTHYGFTHMDELPVTRYPRNTVDVDGAIIQLLDLVKPPKAIILVGAYAASAKFINHSYNLFSHTLFYNLSFSGATALSNELAVSSDRVFITQVVPFLAHTSVIKEVFKGDLNMFLPNVMPNEISFEGYLSAYLFIEALQQYMEEINAEGIKSALEALSVSQIDFGSSLSFSSTDHQASDKVWMMQYQYQKGFVKQVEEE